MDKSIKTKYIEIYLSVENIEIKIRMLILTANPTSCIYPKELKLESQVDTCIPIYCSIIHNSQVMEMI